MHPHWGCHVFWLAGHLADGCKYTNRWSAQQAKTPVRRQPRGGFFLGFSARTKDKTPQARAYGVLRNKSLTMTYFHRRPSTIIGAKAFHCPVRDGKEWYHLAMVVRRNWLRDCLWGQPLQSWKKRNVWGSEASSMIPHSGCNWCWLAADGAARFCIERHLERYITRS
jgi:hypothetical protein